MPLESNIACSLGKTLVVIVVFGVPEFAETTLVERSGGQ
jgi:hypothetical protein